MTGLPGGVVVGGLPKLELSGTERARTPDETLVVLADACRAAGISRVADVTDLDYIGIPVFVAVRPSSRTLCVAQGKGASRELAKVSAIVESFELWLAEEPALETWTAPLSSAGPLASAVRDHIGPIDPWFASSDDESVPVEWTAGTRVTTGSIVPVPIDFVTLDYTLRSKSTHVLYDATSNGLAAGNNRSEALVHALCEVAERHIVSTCVTRTEVDATSIADPVITAMTEALASAGVSLQLSAVHAPLALPCFIAHVWSVDFPVICGGQGTHLRPEIAASRAISEAVQSRLTVLVGTRDDLPSFPPGGSTALPWVPAIGARFSSVKMPTTASFGTFEEDVDALCAAFAAAGLPHVMAVDLPTMGVDMACVKAIVLGAQDRDEKLPALRMKHSGTPRATPG